jgi:WD40 repeat protein
VTSIAFSPDGRRALTAGRDGSILIWDLDLASRRLLRPLRPHATHAWVGGFIDEDTAVAAAARMAFTLDITSGTILWRSGSEGETLPALSHDRRRLCLAGPRPGRAPGQSHTLQLYPVGETGRELASLPRPPKHLLFSPGGDLVFAADSTGHLLTYDLTGTVLRDITLRPPLASWCAMSDGTLLACSVNGQLSRFSIPEGAEIPQFISDSWNENRAATVLAPLPNNRVLAGNQDGSIALVDLTAGISGRVWKPGITFVAGTLLPDGGAVTLRGERQQGEDTLGRTLFKVSPDARIAEMTASPHSQFISGVAAVGTHVLTVDRGGTATMWRESEPVRVHRRYDEVFTCCSGSTDNPAGVAGTSLDEVRVVGIGPAIRPISLPRRIGAHAPGVSAVAAAGAPLQMIVALNNSEVASVGSCEWRVKAGSGMGTAAALNPSRELAATGHAFGKVHVWNSLSGEETGAWQLHTGPILALTFGADGLLYTAGADRCLLGIDPLTGRVMSATMSAGSPLAQRWAENILTVLDSFGGLYAFACGAQLNTRDTSAPEPSVTGRAEKPRGHHD